MYKVKTLVCCNNEELTEVENISMKIISENIYDVECIFN